MVYLLTIPTISITHIPRPMMEAISDIDINHPWACYAGIVAPHPNGAFIMAPNDEDLAKLPEEMQTLYAWVKENNTGDGWVSLDVDGDVVRGLPVYEGWVP